MIYSLSADREKSFCQFRGDVWPKCRTLSRCWISRPATSQTPQETTWSEFKRFVNRTQAGTELKTLENDVQN